MKTNGKFAVGKLKNLCAIGVLMFSINVNAQFINVEGLTFPENAFIDTILSTDFTGTFTAVNGATANSLIEAIGGSNMNTWMDYGPHDMVPGDDGDYNSAAPPTQYVEIGFTDNVVYNGPGADIVVFESGDPPNATLIGLDYFSIMNPYDPAAKVFVVEGEWHNANTNVGYLDLSDLGVAFGDSVSNLFISSARGPDGNIYWHMPGFPDWGVPEIQAIGAIHASVELEAALDFRINASNNDAEELASGNVLLGSSDLEMADDDAGNQVIGLRFTTVNIPVDAIIDTAYLEFETDETYSGATDLTIHGEASDNPVAYSSSSNNISSRPLTSEFALWSPGPWNVVNEKHQSTDISNIVQEIIGREGWSSSNAMAFVISGTGRRTAESYDGESAAAPLLHVYYHMGPPVNKAPKANAGGNMIVDVTAGSFVLSGLISDDGLPEGSALNVLWSQILGPLSAGIVSPNANSTTVNISEAGNYSFELSVSDGEYVTLDTVDVLVTEPDLTAPSVPSNLILTSVAYNLVELSWDPSTDNIAVQGYNVYRNGAFLGTVGGTIYSDPSVSPLNSYNYTVEAFDANSNYSGQSTGVLAETPEASLVFDVQITNGNNDVEEGQDGTMLMGSSDLELVDDPGAGNQVIGLRFTNVNLPVGAQVTSAFIEFEVDETSNGPASLNITAQSSDNGEAFSNSAFDVSNRATVGYSVAWDNVPGWTAVDARHQTPNLATVIQPVLNRAGWTSGNALVFIISGTGVRVAEAYDGEPNAAAHLHVEYVVGPPVNMPPSANAGSDIIADISLGPIALDGSYSDDGLPPNTISSNWSQISGPGTLSFANAALLQTTLTADAIGDYQVELMVSDGEYSDYDTLLLSITEPDLTPPSTPQNLQLLTATASIVEFSWNPSTDNVGVLEYQIYRNGAFIGNSPNSSYVDNTVSSLQDYGYSVFAVDLSSNVSLESPVLNVSTPDEALSFDGQISNGNDDVEEGPTGTMLMNSSDLELVDDPGAGNQTIGLRFPNISIPQGAVITLAYLQFEVDETGASATNLTIAAEDADNAAPFTSSNGNVSSRSPVFTSVQWDNLPAWNAVDVKHQTPNLASIIQPVVNRLGWSEGNAMSFIITGTGLRTAEAYEGETAAAAELHIEYNLGDPVNQAPIANAGSDIIHDITLGNVSLNGQASDDGLPEGSSLSNSWSQVYGSGTATFSNEFDLNSQVSFDVVGIYGLQLAVSDGELTDYDTLEVEVTEPDLTAPSVPLNLVADAASANQIDLNWDASTDNIGVDFYTVYRNNVQVATVTGTSYSDGGLFPLTEYSYTVDAVDFSGNHSNESPSALATTLELSFEFEVRVSSSADDAEEMESGVMLLGSSDLELVDDPAGGGNQLVGVRFRDVAIPANAQITAAYIEFEVDETGNDVANISISAEDSDNPGAFGSSTNNISTRALIPVAVDWNNIEPWNTVNATHQTSDISALIQNLVYRPGWAEGNSMVFVFSGSGWRTAEAYDGESAAAPLLHIEYLPGEPGNRAPLVNAGPDAVTSIVSSYELAGSASDDGLPEGSPLSYLWRQLSGPATAVFSDTTVATPSVTFPSAGVYSFELSVDDGELEGSDEVSLTVTEPDLAAPSVPQNLDAVGVGPSQINLSWDASTDNIAVAGYDIYMDGGLIGNTSSTQFSVTGLSLLTSYSFTVEAYDASGNYSGQSISAIGQTTDMIFQFETRINSGNNDVEEYPNGYILMGSSDLEIVDDVSGSGLQVIGLRFTGVNIPQGATITNAYIEFETDEVSNGTANFEIFGEDVDYAPAFSNASYDVSNRLTVPNSVLWSNVENWSAVDATHQTPNIAAVIQDIVDRGGWNSGNPLVIMITGAGTRTAEAYDGESSAAPLLHIEYQ